MAFDHEGRYPKVTVKGAYLDVSANKGTPFARVTFEDAEGDTISRDEWLTEANRAGATSNLRAIGFEVGRDDFAKIEEIVAGHECGLTLVTKNGELEVRWMNPLAGKGDKSVADIANDLFGTAKKSKPKAKDKGPAFANPPGEDDDSVPF